MIRTRLAAAAAGVLAAGTVLAIAAPAMALAPLPTDCTVAHSATPPPQYSAPCTPTVTGTNPIPSGGGSVTLTVPGVGSIVITVDGSGNLMPPTVTPTAPFVIEHLSVDNDSGVVSVTLTNKASVAPGVQAETYSIKAKVSVLPGKAGYAVQTIAKPVNKHHHHDDEGQGDDKKGDDDSQGAGGHGAGGDGGGGGGGD